MASTGSTLQEITTHVDESIGVRERHLPVRLGPVPSAKDVGRIPLRTFGQVEVDRIIPDPIQPRTEFADDEIERLAASIQGHGQLHPIRVRWDETLKKWVIVSGERRWRATKAAGLPTIDCFFHSDDVTRTEILEQQLVENLLREDLKPIEEARAFATLMELNGWTGKRVAEALRVTPSRVSRALALLALPTDIQQQVEDGALPKTSAYEISRLRDDNARRELANQAASGKLTHARAANSVRQRRGKKRPTPRGVNQVFSAENGLRVTVTANRKCTYYEIEVALSEALDEVRHRINNKVQIY